MATFGSRLRGLTEKLKSINVGSFGDIDEGFSRGFAPASEDARSVLYKYRESLGLDEPPQAAEVASRSGVLQAFRDGLSAQGASAPFGFDDGMLKERLEAGQSILNDPTIFQKELDRRLEKKRGAARSKLEEDLSSSRTSLEDYGNPDFLDVDDYVNKIQLNKVEEADAITAAASEAKRLMREQSVLKKIGYNLGAIAGDINEDRSRSLYWLLNAPQAVTATSADLLMSGTSPNLRSMRSIGRQDLRRAEQAGLLRKVGDAPLNDKQIESIGRKFRDENNGEEFWSDPSNLLQMREDSVYLNLDNFEPAQPGIRRKFDKRADNILGNRDGKSGDTVFGQRRISPSTLAAMGLGGTALATNAGLGLNLPGEFGIGEETGIPGVGRREGYAAASPDELDPRKSNNPAFEIGTRYLLSRDGRLLPKADFLLERPDVSDQEYARYQGYMHGKDLDFNIFDDGKANIGIAKADLTGQGIHGSEVQILGQTLSTNEAGLPLLGAMGGMAVGALLPNIRQLRLAKQRSTWNPSGKKQGIIKRIMGNIPEVRAKRYDREKDTNPNNPLLKNKTIDNATQAVEDFFLETNPVTNKLDMNRGRVIGALAAGTFGGLGLGTAIGLEREDRRRRENFAERNPGIDYDVYKQNARNLLDQKYELMASDPNRTEKQEKSKSGFSRTAQKESLMNYMQQQQAAIDTVANAYIKSKGMDSLAKQQWALDKINQLEQEEEQPNTLTL